MLINEVSAGTAIIMSCDIYVAVIRLVAMQCICVSLSLPSVSIFLTQIYNGIKGRLQSLCPLRSKLTVSFVCSLEIDNMNSK